MKYYNTIFTLLISFQFSFGQATWNTKIPYESFDALSPVKQLIKTNDGGFLVLIWKVVDQNSKSYMVKYNSTGDFVWEKEYDFGHLDIGNIGGLYPFSIIQLLDDDFVMNGYYEDSDTSYCFLMKLNTSGDSISINNINPFCGSNLSYINSSLFILYSDLMDDEKKLARFDEEGNLMELTNFGNYDGANYIIDENINTTLVRNSFLDTFRVFSSSGVFLQEEVFEDVGAFLAYSQEGNLTAYEKSLIQLNPDLSQKWLIPESDLLFVTNNTSFKQTATGLLSTSDNGFVLVGRFGNWGLPLTSHQIYVLKVSSTGAWEWGYVYATSELPLNHIAGIVEVDDGYVFVGTSELSGDIRLVKITKEGLLTSSSEKLNEPKFRLQVFPNPAVEKININCSIPFTGHMNIVDFQGKTILSRRIDRQVFIEQDLHKFPSGIYWIQFVEREGKIITMKLIKI